MKQNQKQIYFASYFFIFGTILWIGTLVIRHNFEVTNSVANFFLGAMPNFGTAWMLPSFLIIVGNLVAKKSLSRRVIYSLLAGTFILQVVSEAYYMYFSNGKFELLDILFGVVALIVLNSGIFGFRRVE
ncbi:hypothetical protein ACWOFR_12390 [Carnobacterium gallinarum]|uniref:hypothetical protein n=1 Tax=Carnobacterium gallinarum TaxID=2749 RepID=UPI00055100D4|nr:hypothetical protein [Carnobacterium gallinarum]